MCNVFFFKFCPREECQKNIINNDGKTKTKDGICENLSALCSMMI